MKILVFIFVFFSLMLTVFFLGMKQQKLNDYYAKNQTNSYMYKVVADINSLSCDDIDRLYDKYEL